MKKFNLILPDILVALQNCCENSQRKLAVRSEISILFEKCKDCEAADNDCKIGFVHSPVLESDEEVKPIRRSNEERRKKCYQINHVAFCGSEKFFTNLTFKIDKSKERKEKRDWRLRLSYISFLIKSRACFSIINRFFVFSVSVQSESSESG